MSLMLAPSLLFRYFLRTLLYSVRLDDGRFDVVGLLYLPGAVGLDLDLALLSCS